MRANACVRKKRNSTPELWRPCHLRSGYGDEPITRVKTLRQVRDTENMRNHILWSGYLGVSEPRMEDLKSLQSGEHSQFLQAHTGFPGARLEILHWDMEPFESPVLLFAHTGQVSSGINMSKSDGSGIIVLELVSHHSKSCAVGPVS